MNKCRIVAFRSAKICAAFAERKATLIFSPVPTRPRVVAPKFDGRWRERDGELSHVMQRMGRVPRHIRRCKSNSQNGLRVGDGNSSVLLELAVICVGFRKIA